MEAIAYFEQPLHLPSDRELHIVGPQRREVVSAHIQQFSARQQLVFRAICDCPFDPFTVIQLAEELEIFFPHAVYLDDRDYSRIVRNMLAVRDDLKAIQARAKRDGLPFSIVAVQHFKGKNIFHTQYALEQRH